MSREDDAVRRSLEALESAAGEEPAHPGMDALEAYVEGRLPPEARAAIERLAAQSRTVAEDLADLQTVHDALAAPAHARRDIRWGRLSAAAGLAAALTVGVWLSMREAAVPPVQPDQAVSALTPPERERVDAAMRSGQVALPAEVAALRRAPGTLLGQARDVAALSVLAPIGTAVRTTRPVFEWSNAGADAYTVAVFDGNFTEVARSPRVAGTQWVPEVELPQGGVFVWQVTAHRASGDETAPRPPQPEARFAVLDAAAHARVADLEARLSTEPLALGILLAEAGLVIDARAAFTRAAENPATAETARRLLASLDAPVP